LLFFLCLAISPNSFFSYGDQTLKRALRCRRLSIRARKDENNKVGFVWVRVVALFLQAFELMVRTLLGSIPVGPALICFPKNG